MSGLRQIGAELIDECRFADAGQSRHPDPVGRARFVMQRVQQRVCQAPVLGFAALDQGNGLPKPGAIAAAHALGQRLD